MDVGKKEKQIAAGPSPAPAGVNYNHLASADGNPPRPYPQRRANP